MNKEERLGKFDKWGYKNSFSKGELARELVYMNKDYDELQQENKQLKDNWNKLKAWIKSSDEHYPEAIPFRETLRVMQELEKGDSNE